MFVLSAISITLVQSRIYMKINIHCKSQAEDELHAQVNTSNTYLENNEGKHIHC